MPAPSPPAACRTWNAGEGTAACELGKPRCARHVNMSGSGNHAITMPRPPTCKSPRAAHRLCVERQRCSLPCCLASLRSRLRVASPITPGSRVHGDRQAP